MKKIIQIIIIIILFVSSILIFLAGLSPKTFSKIFVWSSVSNSQNSLIKTSSGQGEETSNLTSFEPVLFTAGEISIGNNTWKVEVIDNDIDRINGLSNRQALSRKNGMLFVFDKLDYNFFWMKDMLISIDMVFFDSNWQIVLIESNLQPNSFPKTFGGEVKSQYVLEINASEANIYDLQVGDQAFFSNK